MIDKEFKIELRKQIIKSKEIGRLNMESVRMLREIAEFLTSDKIFYFSDENDRKDVIGYALIDGVNSFKGYKPERDKGEDSCYLFFRTVMWHGMTKMYKYIETYQHEKA